MNFFYASFEGRFRGPRELIKKRCGVYAPFLAGLREAVEVRKSVDLGCGRGEWLEYVSERGFDAIGVDLDEEFLKLAVELGLRAERRDAVDYLANCPSESLAIVTGFHIAEHLPFQRLQSLAQEACRALAPGGLLILETPNPENLLVGASSFYLDPTHIRPLPIGLLSFIAEYAGFARVKVMRLQEEKTLDEPGRISFFDVLAGSSLDYAIVAQKAGGEPSGTLETAFARDYGVSLHALADRYDDHLSAIDRRLRELEQKLGEFEAKRDEKQDRRIFPSILNMMRRRAQELYWTLTRLVGLGHLHDGSRIRDSAPLEDTSALPAWTLELALARTRLLAAAKSPIERGANKQKKEASRPRLAYVSPLPPANTGIAGYSRELLPFLGKYYDIDVIVENPPRLRLSGEDHVQLRDARWFERHGYTYDRIVYHVGDSLFHGYMLPLLEKLPGVIVLQDFYLGHLLADATQPSAGGSLAYWVEALYRAHGYAPLAKAGSLSRTQELRWEYPANFQVLRQAQGTIVHSRYARDLVEQFYPGAFADDCAVIQQGHALPAESERDAARDALGLDPSDFIACAFGFLGENKLDRELVEAWFASQVGRQKDARLIFVGELPPGAYCDGLVASLRARESHNVTVTGFVSGDEYGRYLAAADVAVQLRTRSRGQTPGAVLDCMAHGLPVILNEHAANADIPDGAAVKISDAFTLEELAGALDRLASSQELRHVTGERARRYVSEECAFERVAALYHEAIERFAETAPDISRLDAIRAGAGRLAIADDKESLLAEESARLAAGFRLTHPARQLLVDISSLAREDIGTGIQRVTREQLVRLLEDPPPGYRVEPVWLTQIDGRWRHRYAMLYTCNLLGVAPLSLKDRPVAFADGDIYYMADYFHDGVLSAMREGLYDEMKRAGVRLNFVVHDNLPISLPERFPRGADAIHQQWLQSIARVADRLICVSGDVRDTTRHLLGSGSEGPELSVIHLGGDFMTDGQAGALPEHAAREIEALSARATFLMVGTIEPRKGHLQTLAAFERLWAEGVDVNLAIVGAEGWKGLADVERRTIPRIVHLLQNHPELGKRLFWLTGVNDRFLDLIYAQADCLIAASENEGFGLPIIEAAKHGVPILARDIPVFREVAGDHAAYFTGDGADELSAAIRDWLRAFKKGQHPVSRALPWLSWDDNVARLKKALGV